LIGPFGHDQLARSHRKEHQHQRKGHSQHCCVSIKTNARRLNIVDGNDGLSNDALSLLADRT
jgi:hypothetical protein